MKKQPFFFHFLVSFVLYGAGVFVLSVIMHADNDLLRLFTLIYFSLLIGYVLVDDLIAK